MVYKKFLVKKVSRKAMQKKVSRKARKAM